MRLGEVLALRWEDVKLKPVGDARRGYVHVASGKSQNATRNIPLSEPARALLESLQEHSKGEYVFTKDDGITPLSRITLGHQHIRVRKLLKHPADFVIHSFRHTMLTRMGERGVDVFTIMKLAGHSSVSVSQRYVHPTPETLEMAFDKLEQGNYQGDNPAGVPTVSTTANQH